MAAKSCHLQGPPRSLTPLRSMIQASPLPEVGEFRVHDSAPSLFQRFHEQSIRSLSISQAWPRR